MVRHLAAAVLVATAITLVAQGPATVRTGAYTSAQAAAGEAAYKADCAGCHGAGLEGVGRNMPPVKGEEFLASWRTGNLDELFDKIQTTMPADRPGTLPRERNAEILAYLLQASGFPAGKAPLPSSAAELKMVAWGPAN